MFDFLRKERLKLFLTLDIGSEAIKALLFKKDKGKIIILESYLCYLDRFLMLDIRDFEENVFKKNIFKLINEIIAEKNEKPDGLILTFSPRILKGRVVSQIFERENSKKIINIKEKEIILQKIFKKSKYDVSQIYSRDFGILAQDIQFINLKILEIKIDGYKVPTIQGYSGKNLEFRILTVFLPRYYWEVIRNFFCEKREKIKNIFQIKESSIKIIHEIEGLTCYFNDYPNAIFIDVGGEVSQIFLIKNARLEQICEFEMGGRIFSQAISERFGLKEDDARVFKENYSTKKLTQQSIERAKEIFQIPCQFWFKNLKLKLKNINYEGPLPSDIILFGGGSLLPDIKEILEKGDWEDLPFVKKPEIKFLYLKDFKNIDDRTKKLNNSQSVPLLLLLSNYE